ncbi:hypothetical protein BDR26DRAFT_901392 [Obelidium mucronatum]|nr:hypothetical protein BDR26DRAFT_901392 [Obelidium mucronatum]
MHSYPAASSSSSAPNRIPEASAKASVLVRAAIKQYDVRCPSCAYRSLTTDPNKPAGIIYVICGRKCKEPKQQLAAFAVARLSKCAQFGEIAQLLSLQPTAKQPSVAGMLKRTRDEIAVSADASSPEAGPPTKLVAGVTTNQDDFGNSDDEDRIIAASYAEYVAEKRRGRTSGGSAALLPPLKTGDFDATNNITNNNNPSDDSSAYSSVNFDMDDGEVDDVVIESTAAYVKRDTRLNLNQSKSVTYAAAASAATNTAADSVDHAGASSSDGHQRPGARDAIKPIRLVRNGGASHSEPPRRFGTTDAAASVAAASAKIAAAPQSASSAHSARDAAPVGFPTAVEKQQRVARDADAEVSNQQPTYQQDIRHAKLDSTRQQSNLGSGQYDPPHDFATQPTPSTPPSAAPASLQDIQAIMERFQVSIMSALEDKFDRKTAAMEEQFQAELAFKDKEIVEIRCDFNAKLKKLSEELEETRSLYQQSRAGSSSGRQSTTQSTARKSWADAISEPPSEQDSEVLAALAELKAPVPEQSPPKFKLLRS